MHKVKYRRLHNWVARYLGKANHCEKCGLNKLPPNKKIYFHWSNISKKYKRELTDWKQLCVKCHKAFDLEPFLTKCNICGVMAVSKYNLCNRHYKYMWLRKKRNSKLFYRTSQEEELTEDILESMAHLNGDNKDN